MQTIGNTTRRAIRRLIGALEAISREPLRSDSADKPLDPSVLIGIDRQAARVARIHDDPLAGEYARRLMTESARAVFQKYNAVRSDDSETATLLEREPRSRS